MQHLRNAALQTVVEHMAPAMHRKYSEADEAHEALLRVRTYRWEDPQFVKGAAQIWERWCKSRRRSWEKHAAPLVIMSRLDRGAPKPVIRYPKQV